MPYSSLYVIAFAAGFGLIVQTGFNMALRTSLGHAALASLVNFLVGTLGLAAVLLATRVAWPARGALAATPAWAWFGGLLGAFYVTAITVVGPRLGATLLLALTVLGQLVASVIVDHYGWLGFPQHTLTYTRVLGVMLLFGGVLLVAR